MRTLRWIGLILWLMSALTLEAADPGGYRLVKEIAIGPRDAETLVAVPLDSDIYEVTRDEFPDLRILDEEDRPVSFLVEQIPGPREDAANGGPTTYPIEQFQVNQEAGTGHTLIEIPMRRQPLTGFLVETPNRNFSRRARVQVPEGPGVRGDWETIGEATLSRIDFREVQREELEVTFPERRAARYRMIIENGDSPPLRVVGFRAKGPAYRLVFLAAPSADYRLFYGSESAERPEYDTAPLRTLLDRHYRPIEATLGSEERNPAFGSRSDGGIRAVLSNPFVLGGLIALLLILLAWGLYRAGQRVDRVSER